MNVGSCGAGGLRISGPGPDIQDAVARFRNFPLILPLDGAADGLEHELAAVERFKLNVSRHLQHVAALAGVPQQTAPASGPEQRSPDYIK
jgi:hypothetical protein